MEDEEIKKMLKKIFANIFENVKEEDVIFDGEHEEFDEWDSLTHMNLVSALEEHFGISFNVDDISEMESVTKVFSTVKRFLEQKEGEAK